MAFLGHWQMNDTVVFTTNTHDPATGSAVDADSLPTYRVYKEGTFLINGSMSLFDSANTVGFYSGALWLINGNNFENNKTYTVYITEVVDGITITKNHQFIIGDRTIISSIQYADSYESLLDGSVVSGTIADTRASGGNYLRFTTVLGDLFDFQVNFPINKNDNLLQLVIRASSNATEHSAVVTNNNVKTAITSSSMTTHIINLTRDDIKDDGTFSVNFINYNADQAAELRLDYCYLTYISRYDYITEYASNDPSTGSPSSLTNTNNKINYLYKAWKNKTTQTNSTYSLYREDGLVVEQKATVTDNGSTFTRNAITTGP